jgi:hypothetical protein
MSIAGGQVWPDQRIEQLVDLAIERGDAKPPRWGWPIPGPYNGATGAERVIGWQKLQIACRRGWMPWPTLCSICGHDRHIGYHVENYFRSLFAHAVCKSCHFHIHRRFRSPDAWQVFIGRFRPELWVNGVNTAYNPREFWMQMASKANPTVALPSASGLVQQSSDGDV